MLARLRSIPEVDRKIVVAIEVAVALFLFVHAGAFHWASRSVNFIIHYR